jgi:hypothetical protein
MLTPAQIQTLAGVLGNAKYTGQSDAQAETLVNAQRVKSGVYGSVPMSQVLIWAAYFGVTAKFQARAANNADALQSKAIAMIAAFEGSTPGLDLSNTMVLSMVGDFVTAGDVTSDAETALLSLAPVYTSDAADAGLPFCDHLSIAGARGNATTTKTMGRKVFIPGDQPGTGAWQYQTQDQSGSWVNSQEPQ